MQKQILIDFPDELNYIETVVIEVIKTILEDNNVEDYSISATIVTDEIMSDLNRRFRSTLGTTDVLTFHITDNPLEGEIYISADQAEAGSIADGTSLITELYKLIIHGTLHLLKYHHDTEEEKKLNTEITNKYLAYCI